MFKGTNNEMGSQHGLRENYDGFTKFAKMFVRSHLLTDSLPFTCVSAYAYYVRDIWYIKVHI